MNRTLFARFKTYALYILKNAQKGERPYKIKVAVGPLQSTPKIDHRKNFHLRVPSKPRSLVTDYPPLVRLSKHYSKEYLKSVYPV